ncbi:MAG: hypothetical protein JSS68_05720 [Actinobacteria bacterium]|nr:hypothetical protein [Actinomycetota bacterium]
MAETKTTKTKRPKTKSKGAAKTKRAGASAKSAASSNGHDATSSVKETVKNGTHAVAPIAQKAALPLLATGAAVAGAAAVILGKNGHKQRKVLGVPVPKRSKSHMPKVHMPKVGLPKGKGLKGDVRKAAGAVTDAAEKADEIGQRISRVASSVHAVGEATDKAAKKS